MLDGQTQLTAMFGAPERKAPQPPAPVVTPPGSRSKRKWAPANAIPPLALPPLKSPKKAVPPGWMRYGLAPALRRCDECGDDVVGVNRADICRGKRGCQALVCDACYVQSRRGQLRAIAPRRVAIIWSPRRLVDGVQAALDLRRAARDPARHAVEQMNGHDVASMAHKLRFHIGTPPPRRPHDDARPRRLRRGGPRRRGVVVGPRLRAVPRPPRGAPRRVRGHAVSHSPGGVSELPSDPLLRHKLPTV